MKIYLLYGCLLWLAACAPKEQQNSLESSVLEVDNGALKTYFIEDVASELTFVAFDSSREAMFRNISKARIHQDKFYILSSGGIAQLKVFDAAGKWLYNVKRSIKESDVDVEITDFDFDEQGQLIVLDGRRSVLYRWEAATAQLQNYRKLPCRTFRFALLGEGKVFLYKNRLANNFEDKSFFYNYLVLDAQDKIISAYEPFEIESFSTYFSFTIDDCLRREGDYLYAFQLFSDSIRVYHIPENRFQNKVVRFQKDPLPVEIQKLTNNEAALEKALGNGKNKYAIATIDYLQNESLEFLHYGYKEKVCFYLKAKGGEAHQVKDFFRLKEGGVLIGPQHIQGDKLYFFVNEDALTEAERTLSPTALQSSNAAYQNMIREVTENSNAYVVIAQLKP